MTRQDDDAELFVRVWQASESVAEVAERLGMTNANAISRAARYRSQGVPLRKHYRAGRPRLDTERLIAVARGEK